MKMIHLILGTLLGFATHFNASADEIRHPCVDENSGNAGIISLKALKQSIESDPHDDGTPHSCIIIDISDLAYQTDNQNPNNAYEYRNVTLRIATPERGHVDLKCDQLSLENNFQLTQFGNKRRLHIDFHTYQTFDHEDLRLESLHARNCRTWPL